MTTEKTMAEFIAEHGIALDAKFVERSKKPDVTGGPWDRFLWNVTLKCGRNELATEYSMGMFHQHWDAKSFDLPRGEKPGQRISQRLTHNSAGQSIHDQEQVQRWARPTAPTADQVLDSLRSDAESVENSPLFEDWAGDMGYDTDSRKAEGVFRVCQEIRGKLLKLLGREAYDELINSVERL